MGKRGPRPHPTQLKLLHGEQRPSRINDDEPQPEPGWPACPEEASDEVREVWDYTLRQLVVMDIASQADRDALYCYCEAVITHRKASAILRQSQVLIPHMGTVARNPATMIQRDAAQTIRQFAHEFGFTPSARQEIRSGAAKDFRAQGPERYLTG